MASVGLGLFVSSVGGFGGSLGEPRILWRRLSMSDPVARFRRVSASRPNFGPVRGPEIRSGMTRESRSVKKVPTN
jgi:hypothetical protein